MNRKSKYFYFPMFIKKIIFYPLVVKSGTAFLDQALLSAINFIVSIILIKYTPKSEYGYYSIAFSISLFIISMQNAIVTTPLTVLLGRINHNDRFNYVSALGLGQFIFVLPVIGFCLFIISILYFLGLDGLVVAITSALCLAIIGILSREFLRALFFVNESPHKVLKLDFYFALIYLSSIIATLFFFKINASFIFIFFGLSSFLVSFISNPNRNWQFNWNTIKSCYRENWKLGKWALLGVFVTHIQRYSYLYLLGIFGGSMAVADVSASKLMLMPLLLMQTAWGRIVRPHGVKLRENHKIKRFFKEQLVASVIIALTIFLYTGAMMIFSDFLTERFITEKYAKSFDFIFLWGVAFTIMFFRMNASFGLQVILKFRILAQINVVTMIITVVLSYFLIKNNGIKGGLIALSVGEALLAVFLWGILGFHVFRHETSKRYFLMKLFLR